MDSVFLVVILVVIFAVAPVGASVLLTRNAEKTVFGVEEFGVNLGGGVSVGGGGVSSSVP